MPESKRPSADAPAPDSDERAGAADDGAGATSRLGRLKAKVKNLQEEDPNVYPSW